MTGFASAAEPVATVAYAWLLTRRDGVTIGLTSHDRDLRHRGVQLRAAPGMLPSTIVERGGLDPGGLDIAGALTADAITAADLAAGRWDGCELTVSLIDWADPEVELRHLVTGQLGTIGQAGNSFRAELLGPAAVLDAPVAPSTSPTCRATFGDRQCGISRSRFRRATTVSAVDGEWLVLSLLPLPAGGRYALGELRWLDGPDCGLRHAIMDQIDDRIRLADYPPAAIVAGQRVELLEGCDKTMATCSARFGNGVNFRGEPYLPGNDLLTRYPGAA